MMTATGGGPALVTGASGFLGRHLVSRLLSHGRRVTALCRHSLDLADLRHPNLANLTLVHGDLQAPDTYTGALAPGLTLFHLAAARSRPGTPIEAFQRINVEATAELARRALAAGVERFLHVSSAVVFGPSQERPRTEEDGYDHEMAWHPYIGSSMEAAIVLRRLVPEGLPLVIVSPTIVFGPDHPSHPNRVTNYLRRLLRWPLNVVLAGGRPRRNLVFVEDVIRGLLAAEALGEAGEEYILGGEDINPRDLHRLVRAIAGRPSWLHLSLPGPLALWMSRVADRLARYPRSIGYEAAVRILLREWRSSWEKARTSLGYRPAPLEVGLGRTVEFIAGERIGAHPPP